MVEKVKSFSTTDVIMALLVFLPKRFPNDPPKIHSTIARLQKREEYKDLLKEFEFVNYPRFPFSSLLERILNELKGAGGFINTLSPDYKECIIRDDSREAIRKEVLPKFTRQQQDNLRKLASELKSALGC